MKILLTSLAALSLTACAGMEPLPQPEQKPVLSCANCSGLVYFGPAQPQAPDPRVQMAGVIVDGIKTVAGIGFGTYAATDIASTIATAGKTLITPGSTTTTSTVQAIQPEVVTTEVAVPNQVVSPEIVQPEVVNPEIVRPEVIIP